MRFSGLILAAGAGTRAGGPKALRPGVLARTVALLRESGCRDVIVVLGASADAARPLVPAGARIVVADDWSEGLAASLRAGLRAAAASAPHWDHSVDQIDSSRPLAASDALTAENAGPTAENTDLTAENAGPSDATVVTLVDYPDMPHTVIERAIAAAARERMPRAALVQAVYGGRPGHPVVIGADHRLPIADTVSGDRGAKRYLEANGAERVECGDLWHGRDDDGPPAS
ncbi:NTP transferase domain-containing protein [Galbitalea sp. SE-J8]|uniref:nucleotidyltransferase family protein n=1 Tax=Galbitalea sp. SE-J8 TaxID=3054952 RepID=UPI00259C8AB4|nr:NTP transferase domain-containing protein [Galbitalea sp. SE-J8]MDM4762857.1 NTP transferase domain-containing protein [Galbitalea sp. SE-J8]